MFGSSFCHLDHAECSEKYTLADRGTIDRQEESIGFEWMNIKINCNNLNGILK